MPAQKRIKSNEHLCSNLTHVLSVIKDWRADYNAVRPRSRLNGMTADAFAQ